MNREIKFRTWDNKYKSLLYGIENHNFEKYLRGNYFIMQSTGIKDKEGKEIYEGDIMEWTARDGKGIMRERFTIHWKNGAFVSGKGRNEESLYEDANRHQITRQSKVIGNIHENPELLK